MSPTVAHQANVGVRIGDDTVLLAPYRTIFLRFDFGPGQFDAKIWKRAILNYFWFYLGEATTQVTSKSIALYSTPAATSVVVVVQLPSAPQAARLRNMVRDATVIVELDGRSHVGTLLRLVQSDRGLSLAKSGLAPEIDVGDGSETPNDAATTPISPTGWVVMLTLAVLILLGSTIFLNSRARRRQQAEHVRLAKADEAFAVVETDTLDGWDGDDAIYATPSRQHINLDHYGCVESEGTTTTDQSGVGLEKRAETTETCAEEEAMWDRTNCMRRKFIENRYDATDAIPAQRTNPLWEASASEGSDATAPKCRALDTRVVEGRQIYAGDAIASPTPDSVIDGYLWDQTDGVTGGIADGDVTAHNFTDAFEYLKDMLAPTFPINVVPGTHRVLDATHSDDVSATDSVVDLPSRPADTNSPGEAVYDNHGNGVNIGKGYLVPVDLADVNVNNDSFVNFKTSSACETGAGAYTGALAASDWDFEASRTVSVPRGVELPQKLAESIGDSDSSRYDADSDGGSAVYSLLYDDARVGTTAEPAKSIADFDDSAYNAPHGAGFGAYVGPLAESVADSDSSRYDADSDDGCSSVYMYDAGVGIDSNWQCRDAASSTGDASGV